MLGTSAEPNRHQWHILRSLNQHAIDTNDNYTAGNLRVTSGYRCPIGNASLPNSAPTSNHQYGRAFDFNQRDANWEPDSLENYNTFNAALEAGAGADSYLEGSNGIRYFDPVLHPNQLPQGVTYIQGHVAWQ